MNTFECISFLEGVISGLTDLPKERKVHYTEAIDKIKRRANDENLNVAVIGNFSTGKSTFINAFIKKKILKTAHIATTAVTTRIYCCKKYNSDSIIVNGKDGTKYELKKTSSRTELEKKLGTDLSGSNKDVIAKLSTTNDYFDMIDEISLYVSGFKDLSRICIMDTPGINPGGEEAKEHIKITQDVLRKSADAAIILLPAHQVIGASFNNFLEENASHFLDNAIFVITMMDMVADEDDRQEVIEFASNVIKNKFNITDLKLYTCSALYAEPGNELEDTEGWSSRFDKLREEVIDHMHSRRDAIIETQLKRLLGQLIDELKGEVSESTEKIQVQLKNLEENSIEKLEGIMNMNYSKYSAELDSKWRIFEFEKQYDQLYDRIISQAETSINSCTKIRGSLSTSISGYVNNSFPTMFKNKQEEFQKKIKKDISSTEDILKEYYRENEKVFNKFSITIGMSSDDNDRSESNEEEKQDLAKLGTYSDIGLVEGLTYLTGFVVALPLAIVDGFLGTNISDAIMGAVEGVSNGFVNAFGSLSSKKSKAVTHIKTTMNKQRNDGKEAFLNNISEQEKNIIDSMKKIESDFTQSYMTVYEKSKKSVEEKQKILNNKIDKNEAIQKKLEEYLGMIN